jgi:hypothetical protein
VRTTSIKEAAGDHEEGGIPEIPSLETADPRVDLSTVVSEPVPETVQALQTAADLAQRVNREG